MTTGFPALTYPQAFPLITFSLEQKKSVLLLGSPEHGKSSTTGFSDTTLTTFFTP
jgi:hypothetical protein